MMLLDKHQNYLKFLKECNLCTEERQNKIIGEIDELFGIINGRKNKRNIDDIDGDSDNSDTNSKCSSVS